MTEIITFMNSTTQSLIACLQTDMVTIWISSSPFDITANLFAFVPFTRLILITNLCAWKFRCSYKLFFCHSLLLLFQRIIYCEAWDLSFFFSTCAFLQHLVIACLTVICVAFLLTLMFATREIFFTLVRAKRDRISTNSSLTTK